jgi:proline iminopeptidase
MPFIKHSLGKTFYVRQGSGKKAPLIFLHGGPGGFHDSNRALLKLAKSRPVYLYDQIGGGRSSSTSQKHWNIRTFVKELEVLIQKWGITEFHLGGGSWGATLALEYYLHKKGRGIKSLTFISPMFSAQDWKQDALKLIAKLPLATRTVIETCHSVGATDSKVYNEAMMEFYYKHVLRDRKKLLSLMKLFATGAPSGKKIYEYMWGPSEFEPTGTLKKYDRVKALKKIVAPTLIMCGEFDEARPETGKKYSKMIPNSEFIFLKNCSHVSVVERPQLVVGNLDRFLTKVDG